jgi:hypothetical protein
VFDDVDDDDGDDLMMEDLKNLTMTMAMVYQYLMMDLT